ncbi:NADH dehydrogenase (ubiquinone) 1 alpha subcomplex 2 [Fusarium oxysporum f. sp. raphani 54005]|uniref:NADH dehydrogenase (Ubiquinone) 1 alpha subcomplex 2 n=9 Tax=Fusarium oxysporum species complex TaxID=171631 RepID=W9I1V5_FUSOX|nr:NADH dehydrogenase (ubiquinone) 1 alpha subcomplex 2 [Fusarium oxysporum f. sp. lycopersici 4287]XP_031052972.1 NADH dehydrogenase (ubiquinone) 1 alpha subcomplex 2 [Fusarium odoratissimum NRRL 54006]EWY88848.1 NADH dehydrogenase (ubiquinone) 1 alpha subcomplex 2 [Fusarium oxysporum NRRL 32931]EWZ39636.1 NADH dehydrogenase (ubiquinone) 1 alpha subcomplex 2 [Fusarium oxysporum Fo47]EWZ88269.1 NADH dehydrogenase (ubiquinone) 1 alpha subcomplex 2 [Fusarium oxysporum f. sp. lycopersici MN25]EXA
MSAKYGFTKSLREVRFLFCQTSEQSAALRSFITRSYPTMKRNNPNIPILIREAAGTQPKVFARYGSYSISLELLGHTRAISSKSRQY